MVPNKGTENQLEGLLSSTWVNSGNLAVEAISLCFDKMRTSRKLLVEMDSEGIT